MIPAHPLPVFIQAETLSDRTRGPANRRDGILGLAVEGRSGSGGPQRRPAASTAMASL